MATILMDPARPHGGVRRSDFGATGAYSAGLARVAKWGTSARFGTPSQGKGYVMQALEAHGKAPRHRRAWLLGLGALVLVVAAAAVAYGLGKSSSGGHKGAGGATSGTTVPRWPRSCPSGHLSRLGRAGGGVERRHQHHVLLPRLASVRSPRPWPRRWPARGSSPARRPSATTWPPRSSPPRAKW